MTGFIAAGVVLLIFIITAIAIYNTIIKNKNAVERAWAGVITQERQKNQILPALEKVAEEYKEYEQSALKDIVALRSGIQALSTEKIDIPKLVQVESQMSSVVKGLNVMMEAYPDLKSADLMKSLMREISEQQENIGAAIQIFNHNIEAFNNGIQTFPANMINGILNKEAKMTPFYDSEASEGFEYKPKF